MNDQTSEQERLKAKFAEARNKKKNKKKPAATKSKANQDAETEEVSNTQPQKQSNYDDYDSDEQNQEIVIDNRTKIITVQEAKASKETEEEKKSNIGWGGLEQQANIDSVEQVEDQAKKSSGPPKGVPKFTGGKPMFSRKKGIGIAQEEFPELGDLDNPDSKGGKGSDAQVAKANQATIGQFGGMAQSRDGGDRQEKQMNFGKPQFFTGKAKLNLGSTNDVNTRQNYDYSGMKMATATSKSNKPRDGEDGQTRDDGGERKQNQGQKQQQRQQQNDGSDDDGFEVVTDKKRSQRRQFSDEADTFGGGKPQFSRGSRGGFQRRD